MTEPSRSLDLPEDLTQFCSRYDNLPHLQAREDLALLADLIDWAQEEAAGTFTTAEALLLCQALTNRVISPGEPQRLNQAICQSVTQGCQEEDLTGKWRVDRDVLEAKLAGMTMPQALAVWHWTRTFLRDPDWDHAKVAALFRTTV